MRFMGVENEYALTILGRDGRPIFGQEATERFLAEAHRILVHVDDGFDGCRGSRGMFVANGGRLYADPTGHPEFCTAECSNPSELVTQCLAGDRLMVDIGSSLARRDPRIKRVLVFKTSVDYADHHEPRSWGCHENYLMRREALPNLAESLIPHLVSRVVYTGSGGFDAFKAGLEFLVSPRAAFIRTATSQDTMGNRGLLNTRDESLSGGAYFRVHLVVAEPLQSETAQWLRAATTALVIAVAERGHALRADLRYRDAVAALRTYAADPACTAKATLRRRGGITAVDMQRACMGFVRDHLDEPGLPEWAPLACERWQAMLDVLARKPAALAGTLDWAMRYRLYARRVAQTPGMDVARIRRWTWFLDRMRNRVAETDCAGEGKAIDAVVAGTETLSADLRRRIDAIAKELGAADLTSEHLEEFLRFRRECHEIDARFADLGGGLFETLDAAGALDHRLPDVVRGREALVVAPAVGRGRLRAEIIRRAADDERPRLSATWQRIHDLKQMRVLVLDDPYAAVEGLPQWRPMTGL